MVMAACYEAMEREGKLKQSYARGANNREQKGGIVSHADSSNSLRGLHTNETKLTKGDAAAWGKIFCFDAPLRQGTSLFELLACFEDILGDFLLETGWCPFVVV